VADKETEGKSKAMKEIERLAKEQVKKEAEGPRQAEDTVKSKKEAEAAEKKARKEAEKLAKEKAKKEAEEAKKAKKEAEKLAKEQAKQAKKAKTAKVEPGMDAGTATYEGTFQLVLPLTVGFKQVRQIADYLTEIEGVKVVWTGGSVDEGTFIAISVTKAMPVASIISKMPMVEGVEVKGDKIAVTLKGAV